MIIDYTKLKRFGASFLDAAKTTDDNGGWNWANVQELANLAAEVLGFDGDEITEIMDNMLDGETVVVEHDAVILTFTGGGTKPGDGITLRAMPAADANLIRSVIMTVETHLLNGGDADIEDLTAAWGLVEGDMAGTSASPV